MFDFDLADLYEVPIKALNQSVNRNMERFPEDFMFRLTSIEWEIMRSQIVTAQDDTPILQLITNQNKRNINVLPFVFTEQGIAMLSGVLHSEKPSK